MSLRPFEAKVICMTFEINSKLGVLTQAGKKLNSFGIIFGKNRSMCVPRNENSKKRNIPSLGDVANLVGCKGEASLDGCIGDAILEVGACCIGNNGL